MADVTTTILTIRPDQGKFDDTQRAALESLGIAEAPEGDQQLFLHVAQRSGLDPFAKQIYLIPRWDGRSKKNKWTIQTSIDGLRVIRDRIGKFEGLTTEWCGSDGQWTDVWLSDKAPAAARVSIYVTGFQVPIRGIALWREYVQTTREGNVTSMWDTKRSVMIAKCAEAIGYRQAFPQDFSGLYVSEEMPATEQDSDGVYVTTMMRDEKPGAHNGKRGHANKTGVNARPDRDATPAGAPRRGRSRPQEAAAGPAIPKTAVAEEWAERVNAVDNLDALFELHEDAAKLNVLDHKTQLDRTVESAFLARRDALQAKPTARPVEPEYNDETPF